MKIAIILFPGTNRERDMSFAIQRATGITPKIIWHKETSLEGFDLIILPGGFSFGDYLRSGAIAAHSPIMDSLKQQAKKGVMVLGVCNGFQILTEAGLLPGVLLRNRDMKFMCKSHDFVIGSEAQVVSSPYFRQYAKGQIVNFPMANNDGNYQIDAEGLKRLEGEGRIALRYASPEGIISDAFNPNGSISNIAGIMNENGRIMGMMPHPENACLDNRGTLDGLNLFQAFA